MLRVALKSIIARKGRLLLTAIAVIAGTAFLSGVFVFSDTIRNSFDQLFANAYANVDTLVRSDNVLEGDFGVESRDRVDLAIVDELVALPNVEEVEGFVGGFARMATADGDPVGVDGPPKFGGNFSDSALSPFEIAEGAAPVGPDQVAVDRASAKNSKIAVGDTINVTTQAGSRDFSVVGITTFAGSDSSGGASWALFDLATASSFVLDQPGYVDEIRIRGDGSVSQEFLTAEIADSVAGTDLEALTGEQIITENQDDIQRGLSFVTIFLSIFALIALFVGSFIIYNVFSISAAQREKENALLRAIGASRSQVTRVVFAEAAVVGVVGAVLGFVGGVGLAAMITSILTAVGFGPTDTNLVVKPWVFVVTLIVGFVVTLVCAVGPAIRSGRVPPLAAMRDVAVDNSGVSRRRASIGTVVVAIGVITTALGLTSDPLWLGVGVLCLFVALVVLGPLVVAPIAAALSRPLRLVASVTGEMAGRNAVRNPKRTSVTAGALAVGITLLIGIASLGSSVKESIREAVGEQFNGDYTIGAEQDGGGFGGLPIVLSDQLNELPEVEAAGGIGGNLIALVEDGQPAAKTVLTVDPAVIANVLDFQFQGGGWDRLDATGILVSTDKAERDGLALGDSVDVVLQNGTEIELEIAGLYENDDFGNLIVDRDLFADQQTAVFDQQVLINTVDGVSEDAALAAIRTVTDQYPSGTLQTRKEFIDDQTGQVDTFLNFMYALLGMSIFIAAVGIVITLLLAVYERRHELGLLRAVGMTRGQVRSSIRWESIITALLGVVMGTVLGLSLGWIIVQALKDQGLRTFAVPVGTVIVILVGSVVLALGAAYWPARRAARADILSAIATE